MLEAPGPLYTQQRLVLEATKVSRATQAGPWGAGGGGALGVMRWGDDVLLVLALSPLTNSMHAPSSACSLCHCFPHTHKTCGSGTAHPCCSKGDG